MDLHHDQEAQPSTSPQIGRTSTESIAERFPNFTPPKISAPQGGGSVRPTDGKFQVNASSGAATYDLPIPTTKGRNGFGPELALKYNTQAGNSAFGLGWQLDIGSISRKIDKGWPRYGLSSHEDVFVLTGIEDLVPMLRKDTLTDTWATDKNGNYIIEEISRDGWDIRQYLPRVEGTFSRIERWTNISEPDDVHWRTVSGLSVVTLYGLDDGSRIFTQSKNGCKRIFSWLACETYDMKGSSMLYRYKRETSENVIITDAHEMNRPESSRTTNMYLKSIHYGNKKPNRGDSLDSIVRASQYADNDWMFSVVLDYGEHDEDNPSSKQLKPWTCRIDPFSTYHAGFEIRTYRLCQRMIMFHHFPDELGVDDYPIGWTSLHFNSTPKLSFLAGITRTFCQLQDQVLRRKEVPSIQLKYAPCAALSGSVPQKLQVESLNDIHGALGRNYQFIDLYGEGSPGIFTEQDGSWFYKRNRGTINRASVPTQPLREARFNDAMLISPTPRTKFESSMAQFIDIDGDGLPELLVQTNNSLGYYQRDHEGNWTIFQDISAAPRVSLNDPNVKIVDVTGDGLPDIFVGTGDVSTIYSFTLPHQFESWEQIMVASQEDKGPFVLFSDPKATISFARLSGGSLPDLVRICNRDISYWPSLGYGRFGPRVVMSNAPTFDSDCDFDSKRIHLADIDGSGTDDVLYCGHKGAVVFHNQAGNSWSTGEQVVNFPEWTQDMSIAVLDLLGTGTSCLVWSSPYPADTRSSLRYIDLSEGQKPHVLTEVINSCGLEISIRYAPSTKFYLRDLEDSHPWTTAVPFPVHCVENEIIVDRITQTQYSTKYSYHGGYYDWHEREFRGFSMVEKWDFDAGIRHDGQIGANGPQNMEPDFFSPPSKTKTWFHTGNYLNEPPIAPHAATQYWRPPSEDVAKNSTWKLPPTVLPAGVLTPEEIRSACRSLKSSTLRSEIYADDDTALKDIPYQITEQNSTLVMVQPQQSRLVPGVFWSHPREVITHHLERNPADTRIQHAITLEVDKFGNTLRSISVAYGRSTLDSGVPAKWAERQKQSHITFTSNLMTLPIDTAHVRLNPVLYSTSSYEVQNFSNNGKFFTFNDFIGVEAMQEVPYHGDNTQGTAFKRLLSRSENYFRSNDLAKNLPLGRIDSLAIPYQSYAMAMSRTHIDLLLVDSSTGQKLFPDSYEVLTGRGPDAGWYVDLHGDGNYWIPSGTYKFNPASNILSESEASAALQNFYAPCMYTSGVGQVTMITYDQYSFLPIKTSNIVGLSIEATYDYACMGAKIVTDSNGNQSFAAYNEYGVLCGVAISGKSGENMGDSIDKFIKFRSEEEIEAFFQDPSQQRAKDLLGSATRCSFGTYQPYQHDGSPLYSFSLAREFHESENGPGQIHISFQYGDGFGRTVQTKTLCEPGPLTEVDTDTLPVRWLTSGTSVFNNKGKVVRQYEPYFDPDHRCNLNSRRGASSIMFYDALDRGIGKLNPDRSWEKTVLSSWKQEAWDVVDTVGIIDPASDLNVGAYFRQLSNKQLYLPSWYQSRIDGQKGENERQSAITSMKHSNTPLIAYFDSLGRPFLSIADNGPAGKFSTASDQDIQGRVLNTYDAYNRKVSTNYYTMLGALVSQLDMDSGARLAITDVDGNPIRSWNARGFRTRHVYDELRRESQLVLKQAPESEEIIVLRNTYGDTLQDSKARNLNERLYQIRDQAGIVTSESYDFKGNCLRTARKLCKSYSSTIDWTVDVDLEENEDFVASTEYNAFGRVIEQHQNDGSIFKYIYNISGLTQRVEVQLKGDSPTREPSFQPYATEMQYNARGQRSRIVFANGVTKTVNFDPETFRKTSMETRTGSTVLQALYFTYDIGGLVLNIDDQAQQDVFFRNSRVSPSKSYTYDATGRLVKATGREHIGQTNGQPYSASKLWNLTPYQPGDGNALTVYAETYAYDDAGNIVEMTHSTNDSRAPGWTRKYTYNQPSQIDKSVNGNRLSRTTVGNTSEVYSYDGTGGSHGLMTSMPGTPVMNWDYEDRLQSSSRQRTTEALPETTFYVYDAMGNRVRKIIESQAGEEGVRVKMKETIYIQGMEIFRKYDNNGSTRNFERQTLHITDGASAVATVETRILGEERGVPAQITKYQLCNQLQSVCIELNERAEVVSYEEYSSYGSTVYQSCSTEKRYRFAGKELDSETGLYFFGSRYYAHWIGRWISPDPGGYADGYNLYSYVRNNPISMIDKKGNTGEDESSTSWYDRAQAATKTWVNAHPLAKGMVKGMNEAVEENLGSPEKAAVFLGKVALGAAAVAAFPTAATAIGIVAIGAAVGSIGLKALDAYQYSKQPGASSTDLDQKVESIGHDIGKQGTEIFMYAAATNVGGGIGKSGGKMMGEFIEKAAGSLGDMAPEFALAGANGARIPSSSIAAEGEGITSMMASSGSGSGGSKIVKAAGTSSLAASAKSPPPKRPVIESFELAQKSSETVRKSAADKALLERFKGAISRALEAMAKGDAEALKARLPVNQRFRVDSALNQNSPVSGANFGKVLELLVAHAVKSGKVLSEHFEFVAETPGGKIFARMDRQRMDFFMRLSSGRRLKIELTTEKSWIDHVDRWVERGEVNPKSVEGFTFTVKYEILK